MGSDPAAGRHSDGRGQHASTRSSRIRRSRRAARSSRARIRWPARSKMTAPPVRLSETPGSVRTPAPLLGEHTERGPARTARRSSDDEIARLRSGRRDQMRSRNADLKARNEPETARSCELRTDGGLHGLADRSRRHHHRREQRHRPRDERSCSRAKGAKVVCAARSEALVNETVALIRAAGGEAVAVIGDASTEDGRAGDRRRAACRRSAASTRW